MVNVRLEQIIEDISMISKSDSEQTWMQRVAQERGMSREDMHRYLLLLSLYKKAAINWEGHLSYEEKETYCREYRSVILDTRCRDKIIRTLELIALLSIISRDNNRFIRDAISFMLGLEVEDELCLAKLKKYGLYEKLYTMKRSNIDEDVIIIIMLCIEDENLIFYFINTLTHKELCKYYKEGNIILTAREEMFSYLKDVITIAMWFVAIYYAGPMVNAICTFIAGVCAALGISVT